MRSTRTIAIVALLATVLLTALYRRRAGTDEPSASESEASASDDDPATDPGQDPAVDRNDAGATGHASTW